MATKNKTFILSDESINTYGFRVLMSGAILEQFKRNPVMYYNHDTWDAPIGKWTNIRVENGQLLADAEFDMDDENAKKIAGKVERGFLRMASIGFRVFERSEEPHLMLAGQKYSTVTKWQLREASIVGIGANHNALRLYDKDDNLLTEEQIFNLLDKPKSPSATVTPKINMKKETLELLNLADSATDEQLHDVVQQIVAENKQLKADEDARKKADEDARKAEAVRLTDEAVKDGRLNAEGKADYLKFFDADFESAKKALSAIPKRVSVKTEIEKQEQVNNTELADFTAKTWDELDRSNKLQTLKDKYPELYAEKYKAKFGSETTV